MRNEKGGVFLLIFPSVVSMDWFRYLVFITFFSQNDGARFIDI